jgi:hypothetical protein
MNEENFIRFVESKFYQFIKGSKPGINVSSQSKNPY